MCDTLSIDLNKSLVIRVPSDFAIKFSPFFGSVSSDLQGQPKSDRKAYKITRIMIWTRSNGVKW